MSLAIAEHQRSLVKSLISRKRHFQVISDFHQQNSPLRQVNRCLPNNLIKQLVMQLLPDGTNPAFSCLLLFQPFLKQIFQHIEFLPTGLIRTYIQSEEFPLMLENIGLEHFIQHVKILGINIRCRYRVEDRLTLVILVVQ
jgi:hypothetical protein